MCTDSIKLHIEALFATGHDGTVEYDPKNPIMKKRPLIVAALAATIATASAQNLLQIADPGFETLPESGMAIYKSPEAEEAFEVKITEEGAKEGAGCLEIALPVAAYASVSFPLERSTDTASIRIAYKGELGEGADVKIGVQSYKMENGFESVDFKPLFASSQITPSWQVHKQAIQRAEGATHWQLSIGIKGPATVWIDELEIEGQ